MDNDTHPRIRYHEIYWLIRVLKYTRNMLCNKHMYYDLRKDIVNYIILTRGARYDDTCISKLFDEIETTITQHKTL